MRLDSVSLRKRQRLEQYPDSKTVHKLADLIGRGCISISSAAELAKSIVSYPQIWNTSFSFCLKDVGGNSCFILASATFEDNSCGSWPAKNVFRPQFKTIRFPFQATTGAQVDDHPTLPNPAVKAFASLGSDTKYGGNLERDLHRWLRGLYGFRLQSYTLTLNLQVALRNSTIGFTSLLGFDVVQLDAQTVFFSGAYFQILRSQAKPRDQHHAKFCFHMKYCIAYSHVVPPFYWTLLCLVIWMDMLAPNSFNILCIRRHGRITKC